MHLLANKMLCHVDLTQGELVMVLVVQDVHEIRIERVDVLNLGELTCNRTANQNSLFRSRGWLSSNQGPVFRDLILRNSPRIPANFSSRLDSVNFTFLM